MDDNYELIYSTIIDAAMGKFIELSKGSDLTGRDLSFDRINSFGVSAITPIENALQTILNEMMKVDNNHVYNIVYAYINIIISNKIPLDRVAAVLDSANLHLALEMVDAIKTTSGSSIYSPTIPRVKSWPVSVSNALKRIAERYPVLKELIDETLKQCCQP